MRKFSIIFILTLLSNLVISQSNIRLNNYWGNAHTINPATIYDKYLAVFSLAATKQWVGITGAPVTIFGTATTYLEKYHTQLGLKLVQDKVGYTSNTNIGLTYAYAINLERNWQFHMGAGLNFQHLGYDISKVNLISDFDSEAYQYLKTENDMNADIGFELTGKTLRFGVSSQNIFSLVSPTSSTQTNTNFVYAKFKNESDYYMNLGVGICGIQYSNIYQMELNLTSYFKYSLRNGLQEQPDLFDIGVYYRTYNQLGLILGINLSESMHISYNYNYHFGGIRHGSYGTNELLLTYNLKRKEVCRNCWY